jgi:hypothetical protein
MFTDTLLKRKLNQLRTTPEAILEQASPEGYRQWSTARKHLAVQQLVLLRLGFDPGKIDGLLGPQTAFAYDLFKSRDPEALATFKDTDAHTDPIIVPQHSSWPKQTASSMDRHFGEKGTNQGSLKLPYPMRIAWNKDQTCAKITLNKRVLESAGRVFEKIASRYDARARARLGFDLFGGSLNIRRMRGGSAWSIHSWGCAIDFDPEHNQLKWNGRKATLASPECEAFWQFWEEEGWVSLGRARNYDWMHVQAARL